MEAQTFAKQVLLGTAIADGAMRRRSLKQNASIRIGHSIDKSEYVVWKYKHIRQLVEIRNFNIVCGGKYEKSPNDYFYCQSLSSPLLTDVFELIYRDGRKTITNEFLSLIDDVSLAVWMMDDGSYDKSPDNLNYWLHTNAFTREENVMLADFLKRKYGVVPKLQKVNGDKWALRFLRVDSWPIEEIIKPVVSQVTCMRYKLVSSYDRTPMKRGA